jgi:hypothetical protein
MAQRAWHGGCCRLAVLVVVSLLAACASTTKPGTVGVSGGSTADKAPVAG